MDIRIDGKIYIKVEQRGEVNSADKQWDDGIRGRIKQILVWYDKDFISGFQTVYECKGESIMSKRHGGSRGNFEMINPKKPLTWLSGSSGTFRVDPDLFDTDVETGPWNYRISSLKFGNEEETYGPFGNEEETYGPFGRVDGSPFLFRASTGIVGFHGCSKDGRSGHISAIGVYVKTEAAGVIGEPANPEESVEKKKPKLLSGVLRPTISIRV